MAIADLGRLLLEPQIEEWCESAGERSVDRLRESVIRLDRPDADLRNEEEGEEGRLLADKPVGGPARLDPLKQARPHKVDLFRKAAHTVRLTRLGGGEVAGLVVWWTGLHVRPLFLERRSESVSMPRRSAGGRVTSVTCGGAGRRCGGSGGGYE